MNPLNKTVYLTATLLASAFVCQGVAYAQAATFQAIEGKIAQPAPATAQPAPPGLQLKNLTTVGATVQDGDKACPNQPYYLYSGGKADNFAGPADPAFPSPNLVAFIPGGGPTVAYDTPMNNGRLGDSFNLQNTRGVCYAVIQFRTKSNNGGSTNDGLTMGHVGNGGAPFDIVAQVINPGNGVHSLAFDAAGRNLLSGQTGWGLNKTPTQSVFDLYLQDDTELDFFRMFVWYGPHCGGNPTNC